MLSIPEHMKIETSKKKVAFGEGIANAMDHEEALDSNPLYNELYTNKVVDNLPDFQKWLDNFKSSKMDATGAKTGLELNKILCQKLKMENNQRREKED